ncbi:MAG: HTH-type transcriptional activator IlvY [Halioglobus sp.]
METRALGVFLSVADTLNFSRSAQQLHMSVSAVSRTIARLEEAVGQPLFERDKRSVRLTVAGREFREYAGTALAEWQQLRQRLGPGGELSGEVSVYCSVTASYSVLAPILEAFRASHPGVEIMLHTGDQADGVGRVLEGRDDIAVSGQPEVLPPRLSFLPLLESPLLFCAPVADCAVKRMVVEQGQTRTGINWSEVPLIVPERGVTKELLDNWLVRQGIRPRIYAQVAGHEAIVAMVGLGMGVGIAPQIVIETSGLAARVTQLRVANGLPSLTIGLCSLSQRLANPLVESFWEVAGKTY